MHIERIAHGGDLIIERTWDSVNSYHCIYGSNYNYIQLEDWSVSDVGTCEAHCGVLDGPACPEKIQSPNIFFFSVFLAFGTLALSFALKGMRQRRFFPVRIRQIISEFAVVISIIVMVSLDFYFGFETPKLHVPSEFHPTRSDRGWWINPFGTNPLWSIGLAVPFSLMATILIFMDQQITAVIVNRRENKLVKENV